ncbi:hypothetical protein PQR21_31650 [Paraburkholderia nemoris]|uniref:hypothetical protein n=1 Tax=Paraburkholderia nemoris TaxID=2793076 RepID=UPI0038BAED71
MPDADSTRVSIPFGTTVSDVGEEALKRHGFDLIHFPAYLWRKVAPRVRVEIKTIGQESADLTGCFSDHEATRTWKYAWLVADESGCLTDSDDFYQLVHVTFAAHAGDSIYSGFARCGQPPDAPLFNLALMYRKYGHGIYFAGEMLPTRWPGPSPEYIFTLP